jgi:hypothetical protein
MKETVLFILKGVEIMTRTLKFFIFTFAFLLCAAAPQLHAQEASPGDPKRPAPQQPPKPQSPTPSIVNDYTPFYEAAYEECNITVLKFASELGISGASQCDPALQGCLEATFRCQKNSAKCVIKKSANGAKVISCEKPANQCKAEVVEFIQNYFTAKSDGCAQLPSKISVPGCGNQVTEIDEDCDAGSDNGKETANCNDRCKKPGTPDETLCGNGTIEAGEECDAGLDNGKQSSGCDIECKKFVTAQGMPAPAQGTQPPAPPAAGCDMIQGERSVGSGTMMVLLFAGMGILLGSRLRKRTSWSLVITLFLTLGISACNSSPETGNNNNTAQNGNLPPTGTNPQPAASTGRWLTGYYPSYQQFTMPPSKINYASMTHLIHWPVLPKSDGSLDTAKTDFSAAHSAEVVSGAHTAGIKVLLGIGGDSSSRATLGFKGATSDANRSAFINNFVTLAENEGLVTEGYQLGRDPNGR